MNSIRCAYLWLIAQLFILLPAAAQNALSVPVEIVRVSNPDLSAESRGSVTLYRINPQYTLQMVQGSARTELSLGAMVEKSSDTNLSADRTLPSIRALWEVSSPVSVVGLRASLVEASTRETEFAEFGRVTLDSKERRAEIGASLTQNMSEDSAINLDISHARVSFDNPLFVAYSESGATGAYRFRASSNSRYSLSVGASRLNPDGELDSGSRYELGAGFEVDLAEAVALSGSGGAVRTHALTSETHPVGALRLEYTGERIGYSLSWSRDVSSGGTLAGYTRSESYDATFTYPFSVNTSLSLGVGHTRSLEESEEAGSIAFARIRSELTRFWTLTLGLEQRRARASAGPSGQGRSVAMGLVYSHPDF